MERYAGVVLVARIYVYDHLALFVLLRAHENHVQNVRGVLGGVVFNENLLGLGFSSYVFYSMHEYFCTWTAFLVKKEVKNK